MACAAAYSGKMYTWERIAELHLQVYQGVLSQKAGHVQIQSDGTQLETAVGIESTEREPL